MDEIIFRGSQKLENLQIQLSLAAQQSRVIFQAYSERGAVLANQAWNSPKMAQIQDSAKELLLWILQLADRSKDAVLRVGDPRKFLDRFITLLRNEMYRQRLIFGCIGFILGGVVGYSVANFMQKPTIFLSHMQAAVCTSYNGIDCATLIDDVPVPHIEESDDILVQIKASSVCFADVDICRGYGRRLRRLLSRYNHSSKTEFPIILGRSCSGIVLEIGQNVTKFDIGDEVYLSAPYWAQGTVSEFCVAKEFRVGHKPKRIGFEGAAGLPYVGSLALNAINMAGITKENVEGKRILVCGACTPIGCVLIQYYSILGGSEISTTSNVKAAPVAKALGADDVIIVQNQPVSKLDLEETSEPKLLKKELELRDQFDVIFVTKNVDLSRLELKKYCKPNGQIISTLSDGLFIDTLGFFLGGFFWSYVRVKCLFQNILGLPHSNFGEPEMNSSQLDILTDLVDNMQLQSVVDKVFHPHDIEQALEHVESMNSIGSSIITFR
ncbi:hypothetical protein CBL_08875 [Carabus blaptoides fortunei]